MPLKNKLFIILFGVVLVISGIIRFQQSSNFDFPFTYDQARDMLDIRVLAHLYDFKISGPTTSITGLNLGPFYYLFSLPAYWLGGGSPQALVSWNILWFLASAIAIFIFFYKRNIKLGLIISTIYLMAPQLFSVTRYFWNANSVVYFVVFYYLAFWNFIEKRTPRNALIWGITAGLVIQFEAAFGSMCVAFSFLFILFSKNRAIIGRYLLGLLPWFIPQLVFEIMHRFKMTQLFIGTLTGQNTILGEKMSIFEAAGMHWEVILKFFEGQFMLPYGWGLILLLISIAFALKAKEYRKITLYLLSLMGFAFVYYSAIYHHELKPWYLEGVRVWYCFVVGIGLASITKYKKIAYAVIALILIRSFFLTGIDQSSYIADNGKSNDPKNAANFITAIDWVYERAGGEGFKAYNYVPEIHDFSPQYMYWWYGNRAYGYTPESISYSKEPVPEYIRLQQRFMGSAKQSDGNAIALMYEKAATYEEWLKQFEEYCVIESKKFDWNVVVEWRTLCGE